jgi:hypothetical protein
VRLLKSQTRSLLQKIDMDSKMKKMAELQLSVVSDPKNRKAIENQVPLIVCRPIGTYIYSHVNQFLPSQLFITYILQSAHTDISKRCVF